jgi:hypothetical protein
MLRGKHGHDRIPCISGSLLDSCPQRRLPSRKQLDRFNPAALRHRRRADIPNVASLPLWQLIRIHHSQKELISNNLSLIQPSQLLGPGRKNHRVRGRPAAARGQQQASSKTKPATGPRHLKPHDQEPSDTEPAHATPNTTTNPIMHQNLTYGTSPFSSLQGGVPKPAGRRGGGCFFHRGVLMPRWETHSRGASVASRHSSTNSGHSITLSLPRLSRAAAGLTLGHQLDVRATCRGSCVTGHAPYLR